MQMKIQDILVQRGLTTNELSQVFKELDSSGDGSLDEDELLQVFEALGSPVTPNLIANLIRLADDDGSVQRANTCKMMPNTKRRPQRRTGAAALLDIIRRPIGHGYGVLTHRYPWPISL